MGKQDSSLKAYTVDALCSTTKARGTIVDPRGAALVRGHFCDVDLSRKKVEREAVAELAKGVAKWVKIIRVTRDHETEVKSEVLLGEMLAAMHGV